MSQMTDTYGDDRTCRCPEHPELGEQPVVGSSSTGGPDPYELEHLPCGDKVGAFSGAPEDAFVAGRWKR